MLILLASCVPQAKTDCYDACDLFYQTCYDEDDAEAHGAACHDECGMVSEEAQAEWSECVSSWGLLEGEADACLLTGAKCHYSPCANDAEWRWGLAFPEDDDWTCE